MMPDARPTTLPSTTPAAIDVAGLQVRFGSGRPILNDVSVAVRTGEFVALIGASGCGKTTLLNAIAGLVPVSAGRLTIRGRPPAAGRDDVCYVLARDALLPWRTVLQNVAYGLQLSGVGRAEREARATDYLERVGLGPVRDAFPSSLSQGMRQRASLARAFAVQRDIYLMDEPFSALDPQTKLVLHDQLLDLWSSSGATVVFVTHDIGEAITLADRVIVLAKGREGVAEEIRADLPRPRSAEELQASEAYHDLYRRTWLSLKASMA